MLESSSDPFGLRFFQGLASINVLASLGIILPLFVVGLVLDPVEIGRV